MLIAVSWIITSVSVLGAVLNARKDIKGFYIWLGANTGWIAYNIVIGEYALAVLFVVYNVICVYGIRQWRRSHKKEI